MAAGAVTPGDPSGEVMMQLELQMTQVSDTTYGTTNVSSGCERSQKEDRHPASFEQNATTFTTKEERVHEFTNRSSLFLPSSW